MEVIHHIFEQNLDAIDLVLALNDSCMHSIPRDGVAAGCGQRGVGLFELRLNVCVIEELCTIVMVCLLLIWLVGWFVC